MSARPGPDGPGRPAKVHEFRTRRRVAFSDTDLAGLVHFAHFLRYAEDAEHELFRSLGLSVVTELPGGRSYGWPRLGLSCRFFSPLRFEDELEVRLLVRELREKTISYAFEVSALGGAEPRLSARGTLTAICVEGVREGKVRAVAIPPEVAEKLAPAPPELLAAWDEG